MSSKKWLVLFFGTVLLLALLLAAFNVLTDPFGAFGDPVFQWWSYDETLHPRVAKISCLEQRGAQYDSYVIGASSSSSFAPASLEKALGGRFYNMTMYGANMWEAERTLEYLLDNQTVKRVVLSVYPGSAMDYGPKADTFTYNLHTKSGGENALSFYAKYLFANPKNGYEKLKRWQDDPWLQQPYRVFDEASGAYDKSRRDAEAIGSLEDYLARPAYACFTDYPQRSYSLPYLRECMESVASIQAMCASSGVELTVVCPPMYRAYLDFYTPQDLQRFREALAQVTDYWDFTCSSLSEDPRFFYDETHFRNCVGDLAISRMFGGNLAVPEDFGVYVTKDNVPPLPLGEAEPVEEARIPILTYHALVDGERAPYAIPVEIFEAHLQALRDAGYTTVSFDELRDFVSHGAELPEKPLLLTFDDGYSSNYELAYPLLQQYGMQATIFAIGRSMGRETYVDGKPMTPHFTLEQAREMEDSGLVRVCSHGYNLHQVEGRDPEPVRSSAVKLPGETDREYVAVMAEDYSEMLALLGRDARVFAYPTGACDELSEVALSQLGVEITLTTTPKRNTIVRGLPQSLRLLGRLDAEDFDDPAELLAALEAME